MNLTLNLNIFNRSDDVDSEFPVEVKRTNRRKTASIKIEEGKVQVIIPKTLSKKGLQKLIQKKTPWIRRKLKDQSEYALAKQKEYVSGESFAYLGKNYRLKLTQNDSDAVKLKGGRLVLGVDEDLSETDREVFVKGALEKWYLSHAEDRLREKTARYAKIIGVKPSSVTLKSYKSRWGSCSSKGDISYNWKIIMAPHHIVDYVVVHELSHMIQLNHSPAYWRSVERFIPDYQQCRKWLKVNGVRLEL